MHPVKAKRLEKKYSLQKVAQLTGINISSNSRIENGIYSLTVDDLERFAKALDCTREELLPRTQEEVATDAN